jgi:hypothetical protein
VPRQLQNIRTEQPKIGHGPTAASRPSRHIALPHELGRYRSKADVVTSHMTPPGL